MAMRLLTLCTGRPPFAPRKSPVTLLEAESTLGYSAAGKISSVEKFSGLTGNRTRYHPADSWSKIVAGCLIRIPSIKFTRNLNNSQIIYSNWHTSIEAGSPKLTDAWNELKRTQERRSSKRKTLKGKHDLRKTDFFSFKKKLHESKELLIWLYRDTA
jgi:hypothetical protein